jgi:hypothetical protein
MVESVPMMERPSFGCFAGRCTIRKSGVAEFRAVTRWNGPSLSS